MTYLTNLIGRLRKMLGMGAGSTTAPAASDPTPVSPTEEPAVPSPAPESPVGPKVGLS